MGDQMMPDNLRNIHKSQDKLAPLIEGLDKIPQQSMKDYYVKLQIIIKEDDEKRHGKYETIYGEKEEVELQNIFDNPSDDHEPPGKILVLGGAGVGKSTLMQYIAYKWSVGELWENKFDYVYRVTLKTLLNSEWKSTPWKYQENDQNENLLKCLAHYSLIKDFKTHAERKRLTPNDMPWSKDERTLLLLDGYDEVAHLKDDADYQKIFEGIFEHKRVIFTSRPGAIDSNMKASFDKILENTGLDHKGIKQYFTLYFKNNPQRAKELEAFLAGDVVIKDICKIPVNIAMLCYIWSEVDENNKLDDISNLSSLYQKVIERLSHRFYVHKNWRGAKVENTTLDAKLNNGDFIPDELKVLTHVAYKSMTGGGINGVETLIIKGAEDSQNGKDLKDKDGISIQSSINHLSWAKKIQSDVQNKVSLVNVYRFGLLKAESINISTNLARGVQHSETQLQNQNYTFIHLTFQEYLTACYLKDMLKDGSDQEKSKVCQYLAEHRNEQRYLMILKFLAGLITAEHGSGEDEAAAMFWDAMICNVDGMIELGADTKVTLLMHLLRQAKTKGDLDSRIPNRNDIINLIDFVVINNFQSWGSELKESDYLSMNIKEALIKAVIKNNWDWHATMLKEISQKLSPSLSNTMLRNKVGQATEQESERLFARALEATTDLLIDKLSVEERVEIFYKLKQIIIKHKDDQQWQLTKISIEAFTKMISPMKLDYKDNIDVIAALLQVAVNSHLGGSALKAIFLLIDITGSKQILRQALDQVISHLSSNDHEKRGALDATVEILKVAQDKELGIRCLDQVISLIIDDDYHTSKTARELAIEMVRTVQDKEILDKALTKVASLFSHRGWTGMESVLDVTAEIVNAAQDKEILDKALDGVLNLLSDDETLERALKTILKMMKGTQDKEILDKVLSVLPQNGGRVIEEVLKAIAEMMKAIQDEEILGKAFDKAISGFNKTESYTKSRVFDIIVEIIKLTPVENVVSLLSHSDSDLRMKAQELVMNAAQDKQILDKALDITLLDHQDYSMRRASWKFAAEVGEVTQDKEITTYVLEKVSALLTHDKQDLVEDALIAIAKIVNKAEIDKEVLDRILDKVMNVLGKCERKWWNSHTRYERWTLQAIYEIVRTAHDQEIATKALNRIIVLLTDHVGSYSDEEDIRNATAEIVKAAQDKEILEKAVGELSRLLLDPSIKPYHISESLFMVVTAAQDKQLTTQVLDKVIGLIADDDRLRDIASGFTAKVVKAAQDKEITTYALDKVSSLLTHENWNIIDAALVAITKMVEKEALNKEIVDKPLEKVISLLTHENHKVIQHALTAIAEIMEAAQDQDVTIDALDKVVSLLDHDSLDVVGAALVALTKIAKYAEMTTDLVDKVIRLFGHNEGYRVVVLVEIVKAQDKHITAYALDKLINLLSHDTYNVIDRTLAAIAQIVEIAQDREIAMKPADKVINLLSYAGPYVRSSARETILEIVKIVQDKEMISNALDKLWSSNAGNSNEARYDLRATVQLVKAAQNQEITSNIVDRVINLFPTEYWQREMACECIVELLKAVEDKEITAKTLDKLIGLLTHQELDVVDRAVIAIGDIVKISQNSELMTNTLDKIINALTPYNLIMRAGVLNATAEIVKTAQQDEGLYLGEWYGLLKDTVKNVKTPQAPEHFRKVDVIAFSEIFKVTKEKDITSKPLDDFMKVLTDDDSHVRQSVWKFTVFVVKAVQDKEITANAIDKLFNMLTPNYRVEWVIDCLVDIINVTQDKVIFKKALDKILELLTDDESDWHTKINILKSMFEMVKGVKDKQITNRVLDKIVSLFSDDNEWVRKDAQKFTVKIMKAVQDKNVNMETVDKISGLLTDDNPDVIHVSLIALAKIVKNTGITPQSLDKIINLLSHDNEDVRQSAGKAIIEMVTATQDKRIAANAFDKVTNLLSHNDSNVIISALHVIVDIVKKAALDIKTISKPLDKLKGLLRDYVGLVHLAIVEIVKAAQDKEMTSNAFELFVQHNFDILMMDWFIDDVTSKFYALQITDILRFLNHDDPGFRSDFPCYLMNIFRHLIDKLNHVEDFLKRHHNLEVATINTELFKGELAEVHQQEIANLLLTLQQSKDPVLLAKFRDSLLSRLYYLGHRSLSDLIEIVLTIIGYEVVDQDSPKRKLMEQARRLLDYQVRYLDRKGLTWINENFERLMNLSKESKYFFKKVYHRLLEDAQIDELEESLIIKLINHGFTTSITRTGQIVLDGRTYLIQRTNTTEFLLENIARAVVNQKKDILTFQYHEYEPIFPKSSHVGMKMAAADIKAVYSLVEKYQQLSNDSWIYSSLVAKDGSMIQLLEQRSITGDHLIYKFSKSSLIRVHPEDAKQRLQEIFGNYSSAKTYKGFCQTLKLTEGNEIIQGTKQVSSSSPQQSKEYFQQELLGLGNTDRIQSMAIELSNKLTDYNKIMNKNLDTSNLSSENQTKIREYCHAFAGTFAMVYQTSHIIDSDLVQVNTDDTKTSILSTIVSFAPFIGDQAKDLVSWVGGTLKNIEIKKSAIKMKKLSPDVVGLNQLVGELMCRIISSPTKQQQITTITKADLEKRPGNIMERAEKLLSKIEEKVGRYLYGEQFDIPAGKLGYDDANTLIEHWVKSNIEHSILQDEFFKLVTEKPPQPVIVVQAGTKASSCCEMF